MGALISTIRDIKMIMKDLKITLKYTAKIVLKVHGIVEDVEGTVQELKATVKNLSARACSNNGCTTEDTMYDSTLSLDGFVQTIESTADSVRNSLVNTVGVFVNDELFRNTQKAWEGLVSHLGSDVPDVIARWAGVPEGFCELAGKDFDGLVEFLHDFTPDSKSTPTRIETVYDKTEVKIEPHDEPILSSKNCGRKSTLLPHDSIKSDSPFLQMAEIGRAGLINKVALISNFPIRDIVITREDGKTSNQLDITKYKRTTHQRKQETLKPQRLCMPVRPYFGGFKSKPHGLFANEVWNKRIGLAGDHQVELVSLLLMALFQGALVDCCDRQDGRALARNVNIGNRFRRTGIEIIELDY